MTAPAVAAVKPALDLPASLPIQYRFQVLDLQKHMVRAADGTVTDTAEPDAYDIIISTETPVDQGDYLEVLGHGPDEIDLSFATRGLTFMLEHGGPNRPRSIDPAFRSGIVEDVRIENQQLAGTARFAADDALSPIALALKRDWASGKPTALFISAGYVPMARTIIEPTQPGAPIIVRWTKWQVREVSSVAIPADPNGQKARSAEVELFNVTDVNPTQTSSEEAPTMEPTTTPTPAAPAAATTVVVGADNLATRNAEVGKIVDLCIAQGLAARSSEFINKGFTLSQVKDALFDEIATRSAATRTSAPPSESLDGMSKTDRKRYSMRKAIVAGMQIRSGARVEKSLELDVHQHLLKIRPQQAMDHGGIMIPFDLRSEDEIVSAWEQRMEVRTMDTKTAGKGAEWVGQQQMQLIEFLEAQTVVNRLGANLNTGLTNALVYPRETGEPTVSFLGDNPASGVTASDTSTGQILSNPRQMVGAVKMSRMWLYMTNGLGEARVRFKLGTGTSRALDKAAFQGTGTNNQPVGLYFLAGVQSVAMGSVAPTFTKITDMGGKISDQNADVRRMGWFSTAQMAWRLAGTLVASAAGSQMIWGGPIADGQIAGYKAIGSTQVSRILGSGTDEHGFGFGNWEYCDANLWGGLEVVVDEVTQGDSALVVIRSYGMGDVIFTHPEAFCIGTAAKLA